MLSCSTCWQNVSGPRASSKKFCRKDNDSQLGANLPSSNACRFGNEDPGQPEGRVPLMWLCQALNHRIVGGSENVLGMLDVSALKSAQAGRTMQWKRLFVVLSRPGPGLCQRNARLTAHLGSALSVWLADSTQMAQIQSSQLGLRKKWQAADHPLGLMHGTATNLSQG